MMVFGNGPNIEMFQFENAKQRQAKSLQDIGFTHISFYVDHMEVAVAKVRSAGGQPVSEPHSNIKYEDTDDNQTVYVRTPWGTLIELQTIPNGYYYPPDREAELFTPQKLE